MRVRTFLVISNALRVGLVIADHAVREKRFSAPYCIQAPEVWQNRPKHTGLRHSYRFEKKCRGETEKRAPQDALFFLAIAQL